MDIPAPTPRLTSLLTPPDLDKHRAAIGLAVDVVMDGYWQKNHSDAKRALLLQDWMDELQDWHVDQVKSALREWRSENPSKKPNPGHIAKILKTRRGLVHVAKTAERDPLFAIDRPATLMIEGASQ